MSKCQVCRPVIAIVGGDGRDHSLQVAAEVRSYPGSRDSGNGSIRNAVAAIKAGKIEFVLLLARRLGHSEYNSVVRACKAAGTRCRTVPKGSVTVYHREVEEYLANYGYSRSA